MRRLKSFLLCHANEAEQQPTMEESWHRVWKQARNRFVQGSEQPIFVYDGHHKKILVAIFSTRQLQFERDVEDCDIQGVPSYIRWISQPVARDKNNEPIFFANLNPIDYHWGMMDGAEHEVPFTLGYVERQAGRNPDGFWALILQLMAQWRDLRIRF